MTGQADKYVINIVSGKGGTGKTLLACVLADMLGNQPDASTIVIDLDIFVRGLTSLLYFHREEKLHIADKGELVVSSFFVDKIISSGPTNLPLAIKRYRSFGVMPAVSRIDAILDSADIGPDNFEQARHIIENILNNIPDTTRFVILDSRAGYDELIAATHHVSNVSICVEEQDPISRVTADNLVAQLRNRSQTPLFRLVNKAQGIVSEADLDRETRSVTDLGIVPFDMDVFNSFGSKSFWDEIARSLYRSAVARAWNRLSSKLQLNIELKIPRVSPVGSERLESSLGAFSFRDRILISYGLMIAIPGITYGLFGQEILFILKENPTRFLTLLTGFGGLLLSLSVFFTKLRKK
jgi:septum site-determining protein MinD